jgi:type I restriction enzyme, S subunit
VSNLPEGWTTAPISSLCSLENGRAFKPTEWTDKGIPIVRIQNLNNENAPFNYFDGEYGGRYSLEGGELLFAWSGTPGTSFGAHIWHGRQAVLNQHIFRVDFDETVLDKRFFRHAINQKLEELINIAHGGVGLRHVTKGKFERTEVLLPPFDEQKRIAAKLDCLLARVDACQERLDRVPLILKRFRQSVLTGATSGQLSEDWRSQVSGNVSSHSIDLDDDAVSVPDTWDDFMLTELIDPARPLCYGVVQPGDEVAGGVSLIRVQDISGWTVNKDGVRTISPEIDREYRRSRVRPGDLLISVVGTIGRTALVPDGTDANIARAIARIACRQGVLCQWVNIWLSCDTLQWWLLKSSREVARKTLNLSSLGMTRVALPPAEEQEEIVRRVERLFGFADRLEAKLSTARSRAERLTPSVLAKAFRGELVPQDPNEEPASALLERIRAARKADVMPSGRGDKRPTDRGTGGG